MRTIAHISDLHFGAIDPPIAEALVHDLHQHDLSLLVISGDLTQRARHGQFAQAAEYLKRLPQPQLVVPGNHDIPLWDVFRRIFFPLSRYLRHITHELRPVFQDQEMLVIGINTARALTMNWSGFWKDGRISQEQLLDVELRAKDQPAHLFKIVVTHHPFIPPPKERLHGIVHNSARSLDTMEQYHIDMLLAGHLHMGYSDDVRTHHEAVKRSILSVQAGTATSTRRRGEPNAYNIIVINPPDHVSIHVRAWDGAKFEEAVVTHFARIEGIWQREG